MESHAARPPPAMLLMQQQTQPSSATAAAAAAGQYFLNRAAAAAAGVTGIIRSDRENLAELERKLMEARQQNLKEEKCNASSKGCGCGCCPHGYVQARDQKATSVGPDSRSVSETSNLPVKKSGGGRQHLTRSVKSLSSQDTMTGAEHGSPNSEGLLLAVDKFLSMK
ncbi:hypothetical protein KC19_2G000500 [Ceratodon purpureus]|uniref:Uncharacterized protein n=1 Tax=Ceratodon purpureus TaxID=3225 RepID=A0A8T0IR52_CERPU|nr:hypothetical protein KC19_2G000500 [Ceratodon purpureus]